MAAGRDQNRLRSDITIFLGQMNGVRIFQHGSVVKDRGTRAFQSRCIFLDGPAPDFIFTYGEKRD